MKAASFLLALLTLSCGRIDVEAERARLLEADRAFSRLSVDSGTDAAFYEFIAPDGKALPSKGHPLTREHYRTLMEEQTGKKRHSVLKWQPLLADVSSAGDFGYTHGTYEYTRKDSAGETTSHGYYVTIWKKQTDGSWKFVMDAGNESPPPTE